MAEFNADIKLKVAVENLERSVRKVENAFKKVQDYRVKLKVDGENELKSLGNSFKRLGQLIKTSGVVTAVAAITGSLQSLNNLPLIGGGLNTSALGNVVSQLGQFSNAAADAAASAPGLAAGIAASTAALIAFAPQIGRAAKDTLRLARVAAEAAVPLQNVLNLIGTASSSGALGGFDDAAKGVEEFRRRLYELNESVSNLRSRADSLQSSLNRFNSGSETAEKIATKLVAVNARLNDELREQADLLRRVAGVNVTELEASKGRKSIDTKGKREQFLARQAQEAEAVQKSLLKLAEAQAEVDNARLDARAEQAQIRQEQQIRAANDETIKSLERRLAIEEKIANVRSARVAREASSRAQFLAGNPNQYGAGAVGPQSGRIDALQAANRLAQQRLSIRKEIQKSAAGTRFELVKQLAVLKQVATIGETINKSTEQELKNQRRINREIKVRKGREAKKQFNQRAESIALGVGFPLLFGGGAGSVGGSFAGSFLGSGFGGQIAGGAIGQAIDNYVQGLTKLADSLESTSGIIQGLEEAGYKVSAATESVIASYQKAGLEAEAYEIAISEINRVLGPDGASKLSDYRVANKELQKAFEEAKSALDSELLPALTGMIRLVIGLKNAFDTLAESPIFKFIKQGVGNVVGSLPGINGLVLGAQTLQKIGEPSGDVVKPEGQRLAEEAAVEKKLRDQQEILAKQVEEQNRISDAARAENYVLESKIKLAKAGTDITEESVYLAQKEVIVREYINSLLEAGFNADAKRNAELRKTLALANLDNRRNKALTKGSGRSAPQSRALQLEQQILKEQQKQVDLDIRFEQLTKGRIAATQLELDKLSEKYNRQLQILDLQKKQALESNKVPGDVAKILELDQARRDTLRDTLGLRQIELQQLKVQLELANKLLLAEDARAKAASLAGLDQSISQKQLELANPFGGDEYERQALALQQQFEITQRLTEEQQKLDDLIAKRATQTIGSEEFDMSNKLIANQEKYMENLKGRIGLEQELEMQLLKQQQFMEKIQPITSALAAGMADIFTSMVDGSKSAEEAFVGMLKNMGQQLIQMATEVLAQQAVLMLLKAFSGGSSTAPLPFFGSRTPGLASGGSAMADRPYLVGENGPELFVPKPPAASSTTPTAKWPWSATPTKTTTPPNRPSRSACNTTSPTSTGCVSSPRINYNEQAPPPPNRAPSPAKLE